MQSSKIPSPARSQGVVSTPRRHLRRTRSVGSPARTNLRLTSLVSDAFTLSPVPNRQSLLNDDTDIEMPERRSWWKKIDDNSRDVQELLERKEIVEVKNMADEFDVEVLSQEKKNYTLDLPESSDGESITSIIIPHKKLFLQKENQPQKKFGQIINTREQSNKTDKSHVDQDYEVNTGRKNLFSQPSKPRSQPIFPHALLNISSNKTLNKTKEMPQVEAKSQVRSLFGGGPGSKRKNIFADFIVSESEDEIPEIQPRVNEFQKRRASSMSRHSPTSSIDLEMDDWRLLPSSTMVENQLEETSSPPKRIKLNQGSEAKDLENKESNSTLHKTNNTNKTTNSKNKSKNVSKNNFDEDEEEFNEINIKPKDTTRNNSKVTRSRSLRENSITVQSTPKNINESNQKLTDKDTNNTNTGKELEQNIILEQGDPNEEFTLQYEEVETDVAVVNNMSPDENVSNLNQGIDRIEKSIDFNERNSKKIRDKDVEQGKKNDKIINSGKELNKNKEDCSEINEMSKDKTKEKSYVKNQNRLTKDEQVTNRSVTKERSITKEKEKNNSLSRHNTSRKSNKNVSNDMHGNETPKQKNEDIEKNVEFIETIQSVNDEQMKQNVQREGDQHESENKVEKNYNMEKEPNNINPLEENDSYVDENIEEEENNDLQGDKAQDEINEEEILSNEKNINKKVIPSNISHDTTGTFRRKEETQIKSPEVLLHSKTNRVDSFTVQGRNTSLSKTKSIILTDKYLRHSVAPVRGSIGFSDGTRDSSAEGSGWDSHRTTRKTLRQTFGKDFTPRKSLRALVMEKTAKLQVNYTVAESRKIPLANSTAYGNVQENHSYPEPKPMEVEENVESLQNEEQEIQNDEHGERSAQDEITEDKSYIMKQVEVTAEQSNEEEQNRDAQERDEDISTRLSGEEGKEENAAEQSDGEEKNEEVTAELTDEEEQNEEVTADELDEEVTADQSDEEVTADQSDEEVTGDQSDAEVTTDQSDTEVIADKSDEEAQNEEATADQSEEEGQNEEITADQSEEEQNEEVTAYQSDEEQNEEVTADQSDEEEPDEEESGNPINEMVPDNDISGNSCSEMVDDGNITADQSGHEISKCTKQTTLETYLQKIKQDNAERKRKMEEEISNSLKLPKRDTYNFFKVPQKPVSRHKVQKDKKMKSVIPLNMLPAEIIEDMKYKPPKRFQPNSASWITKRLYTFLETKLEPKYDYKARIRAEKLVECIYTLTKEVRRNDTPRIESIEILKQQMARLDVIKTHFEFYEFCHEFMPREVRVKIVPDVVNKIPLPRRGVFSDIIQ